MSAEINLGRRVTLRDIARRLDVSHATVSRALNASTDPLISQATRERVRKAASEMGYRPNHHARSLATGRTGLVALWLWTERTQGAYHADVARHMHEAARSHRHQLVVDFLAREEDDTVPSPAFDRWHVDGIVAYESGPAVESLLRKGGACVPIVSVGSYYLLDGIDQVRIDLRQGVLDAMRHLIDGGRRRIAYVTDDLVNRSDEVRYETYRAEMAEAGLEPEFLEVPPNRRAARAAVRERMTAGEIPDALFCHNDDLAIGAYRGLCDLGIKVPDDVALVGCDGIEDGEYLEVPLTTVVQPVAEACERAFDALLRRLRAPSLSPESTVVTARLVVRESS